MDPEPLQTADSFLQRGISAEYRRGPGAGSPRCEQNTTDPLDTCAAGAQLHKLELELSPKYKDKGISLDMTEEYTDITTKQRKLRKKNQR